jgi:hypothetical protein
MTELCLILRFAIGALLLLSSLAKWLHPRVFLQGVVEYEVLPPGMAIAFGVLLVPLESWLAVAHLTGWRLELAMPAGIVLFLVIGAAVGINLSRGRSVPCYCFGSAGTTRISRQTLARLALLLSGEGMLWLVALRYGVEILQPPLQRRGDIAFAAFWAVLVLVSGMWILSLSDLHRLVKAGRSRGRSSAEA